MESRQWSCKVSLNLVSSKSTFQLQSTFLTPIRFSHFNGPYQFDSKLSHCNGHFPTSIDFSNFDSKFPTSFFAISFRTVEIFRLLDCSNCPFELHLNPSISLKPKYSPLQFFPAISWFSSWHENFLGEHMHILINYWIIMRLKILYNMILFLYLHILYALLCISYVKLF